MFDKFICAISIICLAVVLVLVLVLKDSLRTYFKSLSLGGQVQEVLVLGGQVLVLGSQVLVNIPGFLPSCSAERFFFKSVCQASRESVTLPCIKCWSLPVLVKPKVF